MRILIVFFTILTSIGGCAGNQITFREESVIPTNKLSEAYDYAATCVAKSGVDVTSLEATEKLEIISDGHEVVGGCMDEMFILYASAEYSVLENGADGNVRVICKGKTIDEINQCMSL